jgi:hypothetical protein
VVVTNSAYPNLGTTVNVGYVSVAPPSTLYHVTFLAGGAPRFSDGTGAAAGFNQIDGLQADASGNVYVADGSNYAIRKVTPAGVTTTVAGSGVSGFADGPGPSAQFEYPTSLALAADGTLYVADEPANRIRAITPTGVVGTLAGSSVRGTADGLGSAAVFNHPGSLAIDPTGSLRVVDGDGSLLRAVTASGAVTTPLALTPGLWHVAEDSAGNLYVAGESFATEAPIITKYIGGTSPYVFPAAGGSLYNNGVPTFTLINDIAIGSAGTLYVADGHTGIRTISADGTAADLYTDSGGTLVMDATAVAADASGRVYFAQTDLNRTFCTVSVAVPIAKVTQPAPASPVPAGSPVTMHVAVDPSAGASTFQWLLNGSPIPGATSATLALPNPGVMDGGDYAVAWTGANGSGTLGAGTLAVTGSDARLSNLSARAQVGTGGNVLISGFAVTTDSQSSAKNIVVTGKGPALLPLGITNYLAAPALTFYDGAAKPIATNTGWSNNPVLQTSAGSSPLATQMVVGPVTASLSINTAGFAPPAGSADSMLTAAAPAGAYTSIVSGVGGATGVGLTEVFDADAALGNGTNSARLVNLSSRSFVGTGAGVLIAGFVIAGGPSGGPETVMLRGQGPNLAIFGLLGLLPQPTLSLYDRHSLLVASNAGWQTPPTYATGTGASPLAAGLAGLQPASYALQMRYAGNGLPAGAADSAMVVTLPPGAYTVILSDAGGASGIGVIELYEVR